MACMFDFYNVIWENIGLFGTLAILELFALTYIGYFYHKKGGTVKGLSLFVLLSFVLVPVTEFYLFCYPFLIAFGRTALLMVLVSIGYGVGIYVKRKNAIKPTATRKLS